MKAPCSYALSLGIHTLQTHTFCLMCNVQVLCLFNNKVGDIGITALTDALGKGALPRLRELRLGGYVL